jgi:superfamily I DNA and/or RNA helicase
LGSQTESERIKEYNLEEINKRHRLNNRKLKWTHIELNKIEEDINKIKDDLLRQWVSWSNMQEYLKYEEKGFYHRFTMKSDTYLPNWVTETIGNASEVDETEGESYDKFHTVRNRRNRKLSKFEQWLCGEDIRIINKRKNILLIQEQQQQQQQRGNEIDQKKRNKRWMRLDEFEAINEASKDKANPFNDNSQIDHETLQWIKNYKEPKTNRTLNVLLKDYSIWQMSKTERQRLHDHWRTKLNEKFVQQLSSLEKRHEEKRRAMSDIYDEGNRKILLNRDVIGMTTSGAAKFQNLIKSINPKIIVCEEAGEVLEAHILSALTPSTQHLILIGDHNQLRPHIATYSLSMDSSTGKVYQLDKSLFERLVNGDNAIRIEKTQLLTQRRMRKVEISDLIRKTLYPNLIDGDNTAKYPNVCGAQHNVYFIDHRNPEDNTGGDFAMKSHVNKYEVKMVVEMVKYFVRNGYNKPEDIAVLTPYLGQMIKIRDALSKSFVVVIDERDAQGIAELEGRNGRNNYNYYNTDNTPKTSLSQPITLRTVDNFQGEEANIVIISLVRNYSGTGERDSIGFLKSSNRSNVLLSRAREGMFLIGNAELMAKRSKDMWAPVIDILRKRNPPQIGSGIPIICNKHPNYKNSINKPELFSQISPDGGCREKCDILLPCGHPCIYRCHSDDPEHVKIYCNVPVGNVVLPCGHIILNAKCWHKQARMTLKCMVIVIKKSPYCEHHQEVYVSIIFLRMIILTYLFLTVIFLMLLVL